MENGGVGSPKDTFAIRRLDHFLARPAHHVFLRKNPKRLVVRWVVTDEISLLRSPFVQGIIKVVRVCGGFSVDCRQKFPVQTTKLLLVGEG